MKEAPSSVCFLLASCYASSSTLKMNAIFPSLRNLDEIISEITRYYIPEDSAYQELLRECKPKNPNSAFKTVITNIRYISSLLESTIDCTETHAG
jgi:hypothetical protein